MLSISLSRSITFLCVRRISNFSREHQEQSFQTRPTGSEKHVYKQLYPWKTLKEFVELLHNNIVYNEGGLIAINKPWGVKLYKEEVNEKATVERRRQRPTTSLADAPHVLEDALDPLAKRLGVEWLQIIKSTEMYSSGVTLLASDKNTIARVKRSISKAKPSSFPFLVYWLITVGYPNPPVAKEKVGIQLQYIGDTDDKQPEIIFDCSRTQVKRKKLNPILVEYRTLAVDRTLSTSLLEIAVTSVKWHFLRVYAARKAACILGDPLYASRVHHILGKPVCMAIQHDTSYNAMPLPQSLSRALHLSDGCVTHDRVPAMIHLRSLILKDYLSQGQHLSLTAPPSPHFAWTCQTLGWMP